MAARATRGRSRRIPLCGSSRALPNECLDGIEHLDPRGGEPAAHERQHVALQGIYARVRVCPRVGQLRGIERTDPGPDLIEFQQPRPTWYEQPDRELDRRHVFDQIELFDGLEHLDVGLERRPGRERDEGRHQRQPDGPEVRGGALEVGTGMPLLEPRQHRIVHRFGG